MINLFALTRRERQMVLLLCLEGMSDKQIAACLNMAPGSVKVRLSGVYKKLHVDGARTLICRYWRERVFISGEEEIPKTLSVAA